MEVYYSRQTIDAHQAKGQPNIKAYIAIKAYICQNLFTMTIIFDPPELSKAHRKFVQRKQFSKLPKEEADTFLLWQHECNVIFNPDDLPDDQDLSQEGFTMSADDEIFVPDTDITRKDFCTLVNHAIPDYEMVTDNDSIVNEYIDMICRHVNRETKAAKDEELEFQSKKDLDTVFPRAQAPPVQREGDGSRRRSRSTGTESHISPRVRKPNDEEPIQPKTIVDGPSCKMITAESFNRIRTSTSMNDYLIPHTEVELKRMLHEVDCTPENFKSLDYLFIPIHHRDKHMLLIGIAPKQKFAFVIDSYMRSNDGTSGRPEDKQENKWYRRGLQAILMLLDPVAHFTKNNVPVPQVEKDRQWYIFGQYVLRSKNTDKSPYAPQQRDFYNCGAFTMTNAFCLAFGYDLTCYKEKDLDKLKKPRIAFELIEGDFTGEYQYDMIKISEKDVTVEQEQETCEAEPPRKGMDGDLEMQFGMEQSQYDATAVTTNVEYDSDAISEGSDGEVDEEVESVRGRTFYTAIQARLRDSRRMQPNPDKLPWPPQFGSKTSFQRAQLLYPAPPVNFQPGLKYSKRELKKACRDFPLIGWKHWSKQIQPLFLEWMLNEMAATLAIMNNDPIEPANHLVTADEDFEKGGQRKRCQLETGSGESGSTKRRSTGRKRR
ncbi:uncharacterized protein RSE6_00772 [Rhynchosporium secalis]|uniref:Ubiquitin-like protease family profile domain-containing protein n=1 Tax=Rhynchosporium secalis TaxID=38038 RepID=A0A1E1LW48_RHYSE|nr:uncharacterized protein RSE6_00772 [Rhynchosporium secalis]